jgi:uncharacterized phage infection (PIP) family protein YhgE
MSGDARQEQVQLMAAVIRGEVGMLDTRRSFLTMLAGAGTAVALRAQTERGQTKPTGRPTAPDPSQDADASGSTTEKSPTEKSPTKMALEANEKDIKKNIEKLFQLATDLKAEVEKTDSSQVLSLAMVKKAEEIEKLAREIKTRAKG